MVTSSTLRSLRANIITFNIASETISNRTQFINHLKTSAKVGSRTRQFSRTAIQHFCVSDSLSEFLVGQPTLSDYGNNQIPLLPEYFGLFCSPLLKVDFILELAFCHSYPISSSFCNKEFNLFSLSGRLKRQLITVYRHLHSLTM